MAEARRPFGKKKKSKKRSIRLEDREVIDQSISAHDYPTLGLESDEYVIVNVERSRVGLAFIWGVVIAVSALMIVFCHRMALTTNHVESALMIVLFGYLAVIIAIVLGVIESRIYQKNYMIVTNQRAFTQTQIGPFGTKTQVIELEHIEDVGVFRGGVLPTMLGYGEIRLSTERDESAYKLTFVKDPDEQVKEIRKMVNIIDESMQLMRAPGTLNLDDPKEDKSK